MVRQSELAGQKNTVDKKIQDLKDELHDVKLEKSQTVTQKKNIQNKIDSTKYYPEE